MGTAARDIDGKRQAEALTRTLRRAMVARLGQGRRVGLAIVLVGDDPPSHRYVQLKKAACEKVGITFHSYLFDEGASDEEIIRAIRYLNDDPDIHAIIVQLPLPGQDADSVIAAIDPTKDVDGFHPSNMKKQLAGAPDLVPGLHRGIIELIRSTGEALAGKSAAVVAKSRAFAEPLMASLSREDVDASALYEPDLDEQALRRACRAADIVIVAVGKPNLIDGSYLKPDAIVIDVGTNYDIDGSLCGDVDYDSARQVAGHITPVPGGVGPMTVAMLLANAMLLEERSHEAG